MDLPPIPDGKNYSQATWQAGLDEAVRRVGWSNAKTWEVFVGYTVNHSLFLAVTTHAITLIDAGIVKHVPDLPDEAEIVMRELMPVNGHVVSEPALFRALRVRVSLDDVRNALDTAKREIAERN